MLVDREHGVEAGGLLLREQAGSGVQGPACLSIRALLTDHLTRVV